MPSIALPEDEDAILKEVLGNPVPYGEYLVLTAPRAEAGSGEAVFRTLQSPLFGFRYGPTRKLITMEANPFGQLIKLVVIRKDDYDAYRASLAAAEGITGAPVVTLTAAEDTIDLDDTGDTADNNGHNDTDPIELGDE